MSQAQPTELQPRAHEQTTVPTVVPEEQPLVYRGKFKREVNGDPMQVGNLAAFEASDGAPFWIGRVLSIDATTKTYTVDWYDTTKPVYGKYVRVENISRKRQDKRSTIPWDTTVQ